MTTLATCSLMTSLLLGAGTVYADSLDLEPCMNGDVSASGTFSTQASENRHEFYAMAEQEPCMNGDLAPDGVVIDRVLATQPAVGDRDPSDQ